MKKNLLIITALFISSFTFAQQNIEQEPTKKAKQELKLDVLSILAFKTVAISYEYYLNEESSLGVSTSINLDVNGGLEDLLFNQSFSLTPYFRHYFSEINTWNFFGEIFTGINTGKTTDTGNFYESPTTVNTTTTEKKYTDFVVGLAVGFKYISKRGFVAEPYFGFGRNMFNNNSPKIIPKLGINVGYQF